MQTSRFRAFCSSSNATALVSTLFAVLLCASNATGADSQFELKQNDRVVFVGDALIEQAQYNGWIEVMMTTSFPEKDLTFRNLGWSADTPAGSSRFGLSLLQAGREPADEGWKQLQKQLDQVSGTVFVLGYGMASALEGGQVGVEQFQRDYERLIAHILNVSPNARFLFLTPIQISSPTLAAEDTELQQAISDYCEAIRRVAKQQEAPVVDLTTSGLAGPLRKDPIHLNDAGYRQLASDIADKLQWETSWQSSPQTEALRQVILRKNAWWFNRSRPANMAYVFGFRKGEQGQNATEIPEFDKLITVEEQRISKLRRLAPGDFKLPPKTLKSKFAEFEQQPTPEFTVAEGWEISLWAENPLLNKPIHMNFDPQGRLWIASSEAYPMIEVGQSAPDRVIVLEDTNQDGNADSSTVFAEGLLIPTGIAPGDGGVYVAQSTDLLFLRDTDGDGKADERTRVLSGFGTEDTHHNLHSLRWGPDGRLYLNQSVYTRTDTETPHGVVRLKAGGGFRYDTQTQQMDVFFRGLWNSWGHQFDRFGQSFLSDGAGFDGLAYTFPGATFKPVSGARHILPLISPGRWPKFASLEIPEGPSIPEDWGESLITCDFRANRVTRFSLTEQGAGFVTQQEDDLVRTSVPTFRPIDVKQGPDGALYIADWSNPIINHGEVDFRDPRRDRWHGRIWRLSWKGARDNETKDLTQLPRGELFELLRSKDRYMRDQARRILKEDYDTGSDSAAFNSAWNSFAQNCETEHEILEALWFSQATNTLDQSLLERCLTANDHRVRAAGVRVLSDFADPSRKPSSLISGSQAMEFFEEAINDSNPRVRLESICGLSKLNQPSTLELAMQALQHPMDPFLKHALAIAIDSSPETTLKLLNSRTWTTAEETEVLKFTLAALDPRSAAEFVAKQFQSTRTSALSKGPWIELIGQAGRQAELQQLWDRATESNLKPSTIVRVLDSLGNAQRLRKIRPNRKRDRLVVFLKSTDEGMVAAALQLASAWKAREVEEQVLNLADTAETSTLVRRRAIQCLGSLGSDKAPSKLRELCGDNDFEIASTALFALCKLSGESASPIAVAKLESTQDEKQLLRLWRGLLANRGLGERLASEAASKLTNPAAIECGLRVTRDGGREEGKLQATLLGMSSDATTAYSPELLQALLAMVPKADPRQGEEIYRRSELACATCHAIGGVGGEVGPDMTSLGASAPVDYLIESLFDPNAKIKENYHAVTVITEDDLVVTGIEIDSTADGLVLRDASNTIVRLPSAEIVAKKAAKSLMPMGVVDRLSRNEQADLVAFLSQLGKPGDFDATKPGVARQFEILAGTHRLEQAGVENIIDGTKPTGWINLATRVSGSLAKATIEANTQQPINISLVNVYARTRIQANSPKLAKFAASKATAMWIDGRPLTQNESGVFSGKIEAGDHVVLVRLDARDLPKNFRLESQDVAFVNIPKQD
ncbi:MAG: PVC-type heme-binding CxxCH protein [Pirellulaceae bacterium]